MTFHVDNTRAARYLYKLYTFNSVLCGFDLPMKGRGRDIKPIQTKSEFHQPLRGDMLSTETFIVYTSILSVLKLVDRHGHDPMDYNISFITEILLGAIHKGRPQRGRGGGVAQKRTNVDKGGGG